MTQKVTASEAIVGRTARKFFGDVTMNRDLNDSGVGWGGGVAEENILVRDRYCKDLLR